MVKNTPANSGATGIGSLGWEDLLEEEMVTHASIPVWKILWTEQTGSYSLWGCKELDMTERIHTHTLLPPSHSQKALYHKTSLKLKRKKTSNHMEKDKTKYFHKI